MSQGAAVLCNMNAVSFKIIQVFDNQGNLIKELSSIKFWSAENIPDGMYYLVGEDANGQKIGQKVVVQK